jgi:hypothetical protein
VLHWFDFCFTRSVELHIDTFDHGCQIVVYFRIPKANDAISLLLKPILPLTIALGSFIVIVMPTIEFDDQMLGWAEEVHDIGADWRLPSKVRAVHRQFLQSAPQDLLMRSRVGPKSLGCRSAN